MTASQLRVLTIHVLRNLTMLLQNLFLTFHSTRYVYLYKGCYRNIIVNE